MPDMYEITAEPRTVVGKADSRRLRSQQDRLPAIIYGGEKNPVAITLDHNTFSHALENEGFYSHILTLEVDGKKEKVVLKDLHRHPSKPKILHADFLRVSAKTKLTMLIPLHFTGQEQAPGVKDQNGVFSHHITELEVRTLPADLPEFIAVDVSKLNLGDIIHLSDLKLPKGVEIPALAHGEAADQPVVSIHKPTLIVEPAPEVEELETPPEASSEEPEGETE